MVKHTQTISRQIADELLECVWPFCGVGAWRVNNWLSASFFRKQRKFKKEKTIFAKFGGMIQAESKYHKAYYVRPTFIKI